MLADAYVWTRVAACYGDDRPAPLALMATCAAARAAIEYSATGAVMRCGGVTVRRRRACVPGVPVYMQQQTCELWVDAWQRRTTPAVLAAALWWLLRMPPVVTAATTTTTTVLLQPHFALCVGAMHDGDALPRADDDDDGAARPLDARVRGVRVRTRWRDVYARLCAARVLRSDGGVDVSALRDVAAQLTVLQLCGRAARAVLDWLPRCTQLQELTLLCDEQQPRERELDRVVDLCALTQLRKCVLLADVGVEWRVDDAVRDVKLRTYCIVNRSVSSLAACTSLTLYGGTSRDIRHFRHAKSKRMLRVCARYMKVYYHGYSSYTPDDATEDVYVQTRTSTDLNWLARYPQLEYVRIYNSEYDNNSDYSALAQLPRLRRLCLDVHRVDLRTLASCTRLEELTLRKRCSRVDNVSALVSLPHLRKLSMCARLLQTCDVQLLYAHVEELDVVVDASPDSLAALPQLTRLRKLRIESPYKASLDVLSQCTQVQVLELYYVSTHCDLAVLPQLRELRIDGCGSVDLSKLARCHSLERLSMRNTGTLQKSGAPVVGTRLREMTLIFEDKVRIDWIARHVYLEKLTMTTCDRIVDFSPLAALTRLRELQIDTNYARDISWLAQCTQLEVLVIVDSCNTTDYSAIGRLTQLRELVLYWKTPADLSWLVRCTQLEYVDFFVEESFFNQYVAPLTQLRELRLCDVPEEDDEKGIIRVILLRNEAPASATRDGSAPVQYRFTHTITYRSH